MKKSTLKHASGQYVLIVDERPKHGDFYYFLFDNLIYRCDYNPYLVSFSNYNKIIAAENLGGVKGIALIVDDTLITDKELVHDLLDEVTFEDVEVTEDEEYYIVRL